MVRLVSFKTVNFNMLSIIISYNSFNAMCPTSKSAFLVLLAISLCGSILQAISETATRFAFAPLNVVEQLGIIIIIIIKFYGA